jgi:predicted MFS family arabinose efflux permease
MASFTIWHWVVVFFVIGIPAALIVAILWWAIRMSKKSATLPVTVESRLEELFRLRSKDLISLAEYEQQRAAILNGI